MNVFINLLQSGINLANDYPEEIKQEFIALIKVLLINIVDA